jgi:hypothetical protein
VAISTCIGEIDFSDCRGEVSGFARGWFFWIHRSFRSALDIAYSEVIEPGKTQALRDGEARRRGFASLADLQLKIKATGVVLGKSRDNKAVMARSIKMAVIRQGDPPAFSFRVADTFESRCGKWMLQIVEAKPDNRTGRKKMVITSGRVGFDVFARIDGSLREPWQQYGGFVLSQRDFATLLRTGKGTTLNLCAPVEYAPESATPTAVPAEKEHVQVDMFDSSSGNVPHHACRKRHTCG